MISSTVYNIAATGFKSVSDGSTSSLKVSFVILLMTDVFDDPLVPKNTNLGWNLSAFLLGSFLKAERIRDKVLGLPKPLIPSFFTQKTT